MQFTTIQHQDTKEVIMYLVDNKRVNKSKFLHLEKIQQLRGARYNSSVTTRTRRNNFKHTAQL